MDVIEQFTKERIPCLHFTILSQLRTGYKRALNITPSLYDIRQSFD